MPDTDIAIIGAGPYGLSVAAHLAAKCVDFRVFGTPMQTWRTQMPRDMHLKSEGFASGLYEPTGTYTLKAHCEAAGLAYADVDHPVPLATFTDYGMAFQQRYVPGLEQYDIESVSEAPGQGFALRVADGETFTARRVIVAAGISRFQYTPPILAALPADRISHTSEHRTFERFADKDVIVVGAGASALDVAAELVLAGARVRVVARRSRIGFHGPPRPRTLRERIAAPATGLGQGWRSWLCIEAPLLFHVMPEQFRIEVVRRHLGPAPCWFVRDVVDGKVDYRLGRQIAGAEALDHGARLDLKDAAGEVEAVTADHVIAGTGYRVSLDRLAFLSQSMKAAIRLCDSSPALSMNFESTVPGLYFLGAAAANSFGPVTRFAFGARFTAVRLAAHLARTAGRSPAATNTYWDSTRSTSGDASAGRQA